MFSEVKHFFSICQDDLHSCPCFKHFMHWWKPKRHRLDFTGLLHFFSKLKCQHIGLPCEFLTCKPCNSVGIWGADLSPPGAFLIFFFGAAGSGGSPALLTAFGIGTRCMLILGSCMRRLKGYLTAVHNQPLLWGSPPTQTPKSRKSPCLLSIFVASSNDCNDAEAPPTMNPWVCLTKFGKDSMTKGPSSRMLDVCVEKQKTAWAPCLCRHPRAGWRRWISKNLAPTWW